MKATFTVITALASSVSVLASLPEQLFLDLYPDEVLNGTSGLPTIEPWATSYRNAVADHRYGDAIIARYNITGQFRNGLVANKTIEEHIFDDAHEYFAGYPDVWADALAFYSHNSNTDSRSDIIKGLQQVSSATLARREADDKTYGVKCSGNYLANEPDCARLLASLGNSPTVWYPSDRRQVTSYGTCNLRLGPLSGRPLSSQRAVNSVAHLIHDDCRRTQRCCSGLFVSGYSPANSGHRKVCLSSKESGCS